MDLIEEPIEPADPSGLPCARWCLICPEIEANELIKDPPCSVCHDCNHSLAAAEDATWD